MDTMWYHKDNILYTAVISADSKTDTHTILYDSKNIYVTYKNSNTIVGGGQIELYAGQAKCVP